MIPDENQYFLVKFVESQFTEKLLNGEMFFKKLGHFIEQEEIQLEKGIGDKEEGVRVDPFNSDTHIILIEDENGNKQPLNVLEGAFRETYSEIKNMPICCFVLLNLKKDFVTDDESGKQTMNPKLEADLINQFEGRDMVVIGDMDELRKRVDIACSKKDISGTGGKVEYYDETLTHPLSKEKFHENPITVLFYKRKFFEFQREFRLALRIFDGKDTTLKVGNLRDIALKLGKVEKGKSLFNVKINFKK